jgi:selenocysteine lyase/cysteine desulfurase
MTKSRRNFIKNFTLAGLVLTSMPISVIANLHPKEYLKALSSFDPIDNTESFWKWVQQSYTSSSTLINLNNGGVSPQPKVVQDSVERLNRLSNEAPSYYMWRILDKGRDALREKLAKLAGCDPEELVVNRNTTEALATIIFGLDLQKGDEVVLSKYDYPNMVQAWKQRALRNGIVIKWADYPVPCEDDETFVEAFKAQFSSKTKIVHVTHMINWTGQILPVRKIADAAHNVGAEVVVDGAHTFAQLDYTIPALGADYFGTSLHKWLCAPFGTGFMYVKRDKIKSLWPAFAPPEPLSDNIRKFESLGTRSLATEYGIAKAIDFHQVIGTKRKQERLHYLKNYWLKKALLNPIIKSFTSLKFQYSGAIALISIDGIDASKVSQALHKDYQIHTTVMTIENVKGVRITPNVYTTLEELDKLVVALNGIAKR